MPTRRVTNAFVRIQNRLAEDLAPLTDNEREQLLLMIRDNAARRLRVCPKEPVDDDGSALCDCGDPVLDLSH